MRLFHELVFEKYFDGSTGFGGYSQRVAWGPVMGAVDAVRFMILVDGVSGTSLSLQILAQGRPEQTDLYFADPYLIFSKDFGTGFVAGQSYIFSGSIPPSDPAAPSSYDCHLYVSFNGDVDPAPTPRAHVRIWATGRGRA